MRREARKIPLGLVFLFACLPLFGWWMTGLFDVDEGFYGAVVAEMNRRHEWITPYFNGHPWFEKPILLYWLAKPCMMLRSAAARATSWVIATTLERCIAPTAMRASSLRELALEPLVNLVHHDHWCNNLG